ncbi:MAG TPA: hypothetical protein VE338_20020 [Ktedonobacterales bacterium]|jgi:hypothetical protein|nr:hypothetical protein [Ktedonobacterales bacterium]
MNTRMTAPRHALALAIMVLALALLACAGPVPLATSTPTPCPANCPPPARLSSTGHTVTLTGFQFTYFDPWSLDKANSDSHSATLVAQSQLGQVSALLESVSVSPGETSQRLLTSAVNNNLNSGQFTGSQDEGPINGAEIGYVAGSGEAYAATVSQGNAPDQPVYLDFMASVRGSTGIIFIALSPLDPNSPDPSIVPNQEYDHLVNSVEWR